MATTLTCPACNKVLKSNAAIPAGKVVKCPGCQKPFKVPAENEAVQAKPTTGVKKPVTQANGKPAPGNGFQSKKNPAADDPLKKKKPRLDDEDDRPRKKSRRDEDEDEEDLPRSKKKSSRDEDDDDDDRPKSKKKSLRDDDDDDDDRPRKKRSRDDDDEEDDDDDRPSKSRRGSKSNKKTLLLAAGGGGLLLVVLLVTAFVWPGFMLSSGGSGAKGDTKPGDKDASKPGIDFTLYLPENADFAVGINIGGSENAMLKKGIKALGDAMKKADPAKADFFGDLTLMVVAGETSRTPNDGMVAVMLTDGAHDLEKLRASSKAKPQKLKEKAVFRTPMEGLFYMPDPRTLLAFKMADDEAGKLMGSTKCALKRQEMLQQIKKVSGKSIWVVMALDGDLRKQIKEVASAARLKEKLEIPNAEELAPVLAAAKLLTITANLEGGAIKFEVSMTCKNPADAKKAAKVLEGASKLVQDKASDQKDVPEESQALVKSLVTDLAGFKLGASGSDVAASLTFSKATVDEISKLMDGLLKNIPQFGEVGGGGVGDPARVQSSNNLKQMILAMHSFHDANQRLPPQAICSKTDGRPLLSWRVAILPYIEQLPLYNEFKLDEPWDSPHNIKLLPRMPPIYAAPGVAGPPGNTFYQVFTGPGAGFELQTMMNSQFGAMGMGLAGGFPNGTSNVIGIAEAAQPVPWTKPADLTFSPQKALPRVGGTVFPDGFNAGMISGECRFFPNPDAKTLRSFILRAPEQ